MCLKMSIIPSFVFKILRYDIYPSYFVFIFVMTIFQDGSVKSYDLMIVLKLPYRTKILRKMCRNFSLVSKILSDETFCPSKNLSNISIQKLGKNRKKLSKFRLGVENFVRRNILSVENFVR